MGKTSEWVLEGHNQEREDFSIVGTWSHPGRFSFDLATGAAKFPRDLTAPGMLHAQALRSPYGHATVRILDTSAAEALEGVELVLTHEDEEIVASPAKISPWFLLGASPLLGTEAEYEGDEVGVVVVARTPELCEEALALIKVEWTVLPHVIDPRDARATDAPVLRPEMNQYSNLAGNTFGAPNVWEDGNVEEGLKQADHIVEFAYGWPMWSQMRPMPAAYLSWWAPDPFGNLDRQTLYVCNDSHFTNQGPKGSAILGLGLADDQVRVLTPHMGARYCDFQEKRGAQLAPLLSRRLGGRPVRYWYTRRNAFDAAVPASYFRTRIGFTDDGRLVAVQNENVHQSGARGGYGDKTNGHLVLPPQSTAFRATSCPNIHSVYHQMVTNGAATTADPGANRWEPVALALHVMATELKKDPTQVILDNVHTTKPSLEACIEAGKQAIGWDAKWHLPGEKTLEDGRLHGIAVVPRNAITWGMINYNISLSIRPDGKLYLPYAEGQIGTYWPDAAALVIAEEFGTVPEDVVVYYAANYPNWTNGDAADRGSSVTWAAKEAALKLKESYLEAVAPARGIDAANADIKGSELFDRSDPDNPEKRFRLADIGTHVAVNFIGKPTAYDDSLKTLRTMTADFVEVAVDPETGEVEVLDYVCAHDFGKVIRPSSAFGQLENALTQSCGGALREELVWDEESGVLLNGNLLDYKVSTQLDQPPFQTVPVETRCGGGAYGSVGVAHAHFSRLLIALAVQNAIGTYLETAPATPDKILRALGKIGEDVS
jgi:CO/xanthine dehydrogenase Mo-binding subunit